jgi:hypothetical protein
MHEVLHLRDRLSSALLMQEDAQLYDYLDMMYTCHSE